MANTTAEKIKVMQAFERGEKIQVRFVGDLTWNESPKPSWDWCLREYRVKPKTQKVYFAILRKNCGGLITTNPKSKIEHERTIAGYRQTAKVIKTFCEELEE